MPTRTARCIALSIFFCVGLPTLAHAQDFAKGARPMGMGEAFTGISTGTAGVYNNPAGIARAILFAAEGSYTYTPTGNLLSAAVVDSKTNPAITAGLSIGYYFDRQRDNGDDISALDFRLPLAMPIVPEKISIGFGLRYLSISNKDIETLSGLTLDAGALFQIIDGLHVGVAVKNILDPCETASRCEGIVPLTIGGGISYGSLANAFVVSGDINYDLSGVEGAGLNFALGGEYLVERMIPIRIGFKREALPNSNIVTVGTGWRSTTAGLDASYQHIISSDGQSTGPGQITLGVSVSR